MNFNMTSAGDMAGAFAIFGILTFILHLCMALAVNGDAKRLKKDRAGLFLFGPLFWGVLTSGCPLRPDGLGPGSDSGWNSKPFRNVVVRPLPENGLLRLSGMSETDPGSGETR